MVNNIKILFVLPILFNLGLASTNGQAGTDSEGGSHGIAFESNDQESMLSVDSHETPGHDNMNTESVSQDDTDSAATYLLEFGKSLKECAVDLVDVMFDKTVNLSEIQRALIRFDDHQQAPQLVDRACSENVSRMKQFFSPELPPATKDGPLCFKTLNDKIKSRLTEKKIAIENWNEKLMNKPEWPQYRKECLILQRKLLTVKDWFEKEGLKEQPDVKPKKDLDLSWMSDCKSDQLLGWKEAIKGAMPEEYSVRLYAKTRRAKIQDTITMMRYAQNDFLFVKSAIATEEQMKQKIEISIVDLMRNFFMKYNAMCKGSQGDAGDESASGGDDEPTLMYYDKPWDQELVEQDMDCSSLTSLFQNYILMTKTVRRSLPLLGQAARKMMPCFEQSTLENITNRYLGASLFHISNVKKMLSSDGFESIKLAMEGKIAIFLYDAIQNPDILSNDANKLYFNELIMRRASDISFRWSAIVLDESNRQSSAFPWNEKYIKEVLEQSTRAGFNSSILKATHKLQELGKKIKSQIDRFTQDEKDQFESDFSLANTSLALLRLLRIDELQHESFCHNGPDENSCYVNGFKVPDTVHKDWALELILAHEKAVEDHKGSVPQSFDMLA